MSSVVDISVLRVKNNLIYYSPVISGNSLLYAVSCQAQTYLFEKFVQKKTYNSIDTKYKIQSTNLLGDPY